MPALSAADGIIMTTTTRSMSAAILMTTAMRTTGTDTATDTTITTTATTRTRCLPAAGDGTWLHFDYVPEEHQVRTGPADYTGRLCVIGGKLDEAGLKNLFEV